MPAYGCFRYFAVSCLTALVLAGCSSVSTQKEEPKQPDQEISSEKGVNGQSLPENVISAKSAFFIPTDFGMLPEARSQDWANALKAFRLSCSAMGQKVAWLDACANAQFVQDEEAAPFFRTFFEAYEVISRENPSAPTDTGLMTGYYEPLLHGSLKRHGAYRYPLYGVPDDLITVDLTQLHPQLKGLRLKGKVVGHRLVPYDTRGEIEKRRDLMGHVLCWVDDPVDAFFLQIQGSGRILLDDGTFLRLGYADQNGHPYKAIGGWLIENAGLTRDEMSMQRIRRWVQENPKRMRELLNNNPNFVFFEKRVGFSDDDGPLGAQGVPLTAGASVAVDRRYWPLGLPFMTEVAQSNPALAFARPVIAQDTGGAIRGVIRFDYFWGYGDIAGVQAGRQKSVAHAWVLIPKGRSPLEFFTSP